MSEVRLSTPAIRNASNISSLFGVSRRSQNIITIKMMDSAGSIKAKDYNEIAKSLRRSCGLPRVLSVENIARVLYEAETMAPRGGSDGQYALSSKNMVAIEEHVALQSSENLGFKMPAYETLDEVYKGLSKSIRDLNIASGISIYRKVSFNNSYRSVYRENMEAGSSYEKGKIPTGEKGRMDFLLSSFAEMYHLERDKEKKDAILMDAYRNIINKLKVCAIEDRTRWDLFGLNRAMIEKAIDNKDKGLARVIGANVGGISFNMKRTELATKMIAMVKETLSLSDEMLSRNGEGVFKKFIERNKMESGAAYDEARKMYGEVFAEIRSYIPDVMSTLKFDGDRIEISKKAINVMFPSTKEAEERKAFDMAINGSSTVELLGSLVKYYCEAQEEIEKDKAKLGITEKGVPKWMGNLYFAVLDEDLRPIAICLANNNGDYLRVNKGHLLFDGKKDKKTAALEKLLKISDLMSITLERFEGKREDEQKEKFGFLANLLNNSSVDLNKRLQDAVEIIQGLFRREDEVINATIFLMNPNKEETISIAATTKVDDKTRKPMTDEIEINGDIKKVAGYVAQKRTEVFAANGRIMFGPKKEVLTFNKLLMLSKEHPELHAKLLDIISKPDQTFMSIPLVYKDKAGVDVLLGVINVDGARLSRKDMDLLIDLKGRLSDTIQIALLNEEDKKDSEIRLKLLREKDKLLKDKDQLIKDKEQQSITDALTGLFNRVTLESSLKEIINKMHEMGSDASIMMIDIDHFKKVNDSKGHAAGDRVLKDMAKVIREFVGDEGVVFKYGGEEILVILPHHNKRDANTKGELLRKEIMAHIFKLLDGSELKITASIGIASVSEDYHSGEEKPIDNFIDRADTAMYGAKAAGRNQCWMFNRDVGLRVEETRRIKKDAADALNEDIAKLEATLESIDNPQAKELLANVHKGIEHLKR